MATYPPLKQYCNRKTKAVISTLLFMFLLIYLFYEDRRACPHKEFYRRIHYVIRPEFISPSVFNNCEYACVMTEGADYSSADIVIWQGMHIPIYPPKKYQKQTWVFHSMEPPPLHTYTYKLWDGLFNWTLTYRRDSDFYSPYGTFRTLPNGETPTSDVDKIEWQTNVRQAVWFVSNCLSSSLREGYASKLRQYIDIDIFGKCGTMNCTEKWTSCSNILQNQYRYYLSFENSFCRDYITEKSTKIYESLFNSIPITRNGANVSLYLPPNSYISTTAASTIPEMASYLKMMSEFDQVPPKFFEWRKYYIASDSIDSEATFCELCRRSHTTHRYNRVYKSLDTWLRGNHGNVPEMCHTGLDLD